MKTYNEKELVCFYGNWYDIVKDSLQNKVPIASSKQIVSLRNILPFKHDIWRYGSWTKEQPVYAQKNDGILVMNSMLLYEEMAIKAVDTCRKGDYFELSKSQYEKLLRTAEKAEKSKKENRSVLILPSRKNFEISSKRNYTFAENLLGKENAEKYFKKLSKKGINSIIFYPIDPQEVDKQRNPITTGLWFRGLDLGASLDGSDCHLDSDYARAFGVRNVREAPQKMYSEKQISETLRKKGLSGVEQTVIDGSRGK